MTIKIKNIMSYWFLSESSVSCFIFFEYTMSDETFSFCHRLTIYLRERFEFAIVGERIFLHQFTVVNIKSFLGIKSPWSIDHPPLWKGVHMRLIIKGWEMLLLKRSCPQDWGFFYGVILFAYLGKGMVSRIWWSPQNHLTNLSSPYPNPPWGTLPYLRKSRYQSKTSGSSQWSLIFCNNTS